MLTYNMQDRKGKPLYEHLYECIRESIIEGQLHANEKLPSKRELAEHLNIGVVTVVNAYQQLLTEGYIRSEERRGYFVEDVSQYRQSKRKAPASDPLEEPEEDYLFDFKANRCSVSHFPASIWSRYMREALSIPTDSMLKTVPFNGLPELRRAIAGYLYRSRGMEVAPSQVIVGAGTEYLYGRLLQMFGKDTVFAIEDPGYKKFASISKSYETRWEYIPIDEDGLRIDALKESGANVVHVSPANHFPTGTVMPVFRRLELFSWCNQAKDRFIIEDDYDSEYRYKGRLILPMFAQDVSGKVVYINAFSKTMVPSLRISYMVLPVQLLERYKETMSFYSCTVSSFEQYALARFIDEGHFERHINRMRIFYQHQRKRILEELSHSSLAAKMEVREHNVGTHFLLNVDTQLTQEQVRKASQELGMNISLLSDYQHKPDPNQPATLVVNYAGIEPNLIPRVVRCLATIFE